MLTGSNLIQAVLMNEICMSFTGCRCFIRFYLELSCSDDLSSIFMVCTSTLPELVWQNIGFVQEGLHRSRSQERLLLLLLLPWVQVVHFYLYLHTSTYYVHVHNIVVVMIRIIFDFCACRHQYPTKQSSIRLEKLRANFLGNVHDWICPCRKTKQEFNKL